jgi:hypothetical protein
MGNQIDRDLTVIKMNQIYPRSKLRNQKSGEMNSKELTKKFLYHN